MIPRHKQYIILLDYNVQDKASMFIKVVALNRMLLDVALVMTVKPMMLEECETSVKSRVTRGIPFKMKFFQMTVRRDLGQICEEGKWQQQARSTRALLIRRGIDIILGNIFALGQTLMKMRGSSSCGHFSLTVPTIIRAYRTLRYLGHTQVQRHIILILSHNIHRVFIIHLIMDQRQSRRRRLRRRIWHIYHTISPFLGQHTYPQELLP
jgi:hypothetical protein